MGISVQRNRARVEKLGIKDLDQKLRLDVSLLLDIIINLFYGKINCIQIASAHLYRKMTNPQIGEKYVKTLTLKWLQTWRVTSVTTIRVMIEKK